MKYIFSIIAIHILLSYNIIAQTPAATIPEFTFLKMNKSPFTKLNLESGKMLFFVFFDSDCDHCHHALQYINQHYLEFSKAAIYLITLDDHKKASSLLTRYAPKLLNNKNVTLLQDNRNEFINKFKPKKYPSLFLYSSKRQLVMYDDDEQNLYKFSKQIK
jgi:peroxiredoxin